MQKPFQLSEAGQKGGEASTPKKQRAARANGKKGGRPQRRTLAEYLLRRRIADYHHKVVTAVFEDAHLLHRDREELFSYFGVTQLGKNIEMLNTTNFTPRHGKLKDSVQMTVRIFRLLASREFKRMGNPKPPRNYVIEWRTEELSERQEARWYREHDTPPLPRRYTKKIYFRETRAYKHYDHMLSRNSRLAVPNAKEIKDAFGGEVGSEIVCAAIADDLKAKYPD